jgi:hypothetical protein
MASLADVIRRHGPDYLAQFGRAVLPSHARALRDIARCRTPALGGHVVECRACGAQHLQHHSCRNRACGQCGAERTQAWLQRQRELLLPVPYFHLVFTLPSELRFLVRSHQKVLLSVLCRAAYASLAALCADKRHLGGRVGALAVVHTWGRTLVWHQHVHMLVPGGALTSDNRWLTVSRRKKPYLVPERALAKRFWREFMHMARQALPTITFPDLPAKKRWVVDCRESIQGPERVIEYLGRYIHRTAISNYAIVACTDQAVTFRYRDSKDHRTKLMTLPVQEFLRRFLQHVPPRGFHRVRSFGLLHPSQRVTLRRLQLMLLRRPAAEPQVARRQKPRSTRCPVCKAAALYRIKRITPSECLELASRNDQPIPTARAPPLTRMVADG